MVKIFVYGTLKPGEANYHLYCAGKVVAEKKAIALGKLYSLPAGYPAMTEGNNQVYGFLLEFANAAILDDLDLLENYHPSRPLEKNEYQRRQIQIYSLDEKPLEIAWCYLMTLEQVTNAGGVLLPDGWWSNTIRLNIND